MWVIIGKVFISLIWIVMLPIIIHENRNADDFDKWDHIGFWILYGIICALVVIFVK